MSGGDRSRDQRHMASSMVLADAADQYLRRFAAEG
jgi:hypothetical protein